MPVLPPFPSTSRPNSRLGREQPPTLVILPPDVVDPRPFQVLARLLHGLVLPVHRRLLRPLRPRSQLLQRTRPRLHAHDRHLTSVITPY